MHSKTSAGNNNDVQKRQNPWQAKGSDTSRRHPSSGGKVEAAGIEPSFVSDATDSSVCDCENCQQCRAARALHFNCFKSQFLASLGADLQEFICMWEQLPIDTRCAILALAK
jgi:hypothetical protein